MEVEFVDCDATLSMSMEYSIGSWWNLVVAQLVVGLRNSCEGAGKRVPTIPASACPQVVGKHRDDRCRPSPTLWHNSSLVKVVVAFAKLP